MIRSTAPHEPTLDTQKYFLDRLGRLPTPCLIVFRPVVEENIRRMHSYLEAVAPGTGFDHLRTHVKTHKSAWTTRLLLDAGIERYKCSLHELEMLIDGGARDIFVAYPLLPRDADRVAERVAQYPDLRILTQAGCETHAEYLAQAAQRRGVELEILLDVDIGNQRTGSPPERVIELAGLLQRDQRFGTLKVAGVHGYDGHNHAVDPGERRSIAHGTMEALVRCVQGVERAVGELDTVVTGGTPPFAEDLDELLRMQSLTAHIEVSPGTWIYWDSNYDHILPGKFDIAALLLAQVIDLPQDDLMTLNLGHKRWSIDHGPIELYSLPGVEFVSATEEHTVLRRTAATPEVNIGDPVLLAPFHVCPTVNLWERFVVVGADGAIETQTEPVTARNR